MPVYNTGQYLTESVSSCLSQTYDNFELIAVNDGSTDSSLQVLESFAREDERVKVISIGNSGVVVARNKAIEAACGDYLYFLDSDDSLHPRTFEPLVEALEKNDADMVLADLLLENQGAVTVLEHSLFNEKVENSFLKELLLYRFPGSLFPVLYKRSLFGNIQLPTDLKIGEDFLALVKIVMAYRPHIVHADAATHSYVQVREGSAMNQKNDAMAYQQILLSEYVEAQLQTDKDLYRFLEHEIAYFHMHNLFVYLSKTNNKPSKEIVREYIKKYASVARPYMGKGMILNTKAVSLGYDWYKFTSRILSGCSQK